MENNSIIVLLFGSLLFTIFAVFIILYIIVQKRRQFQHLIEKQQMQHKFSSELLQSQLEVQENTSRKLSEEIHDNVGQVLSFAKMNVNTITEKYDNDEQLLKYATNSKDLLTKAIADLRTISHTLNGSYVLKTGIVASIQKELDYVTQAKEINCIFNVEGEAYSLGADRELLLFRIVQESISNAIKHAEPEQITIDVNFKTDTCSIDIVDDGKGFDIAVENKDAGIGLGNMQNRAKLLGGSLAVSSTKNIGTTIHLNIPVSNEQDN